MAKRTLVLNSFALPMLLHIAATKFNFKHSVSSHLIMLQQLTLFYYDLFLY